MTEETKLDKATIRACIAALPRRSAQEGGIAWVREIVLCHQAAARQSLEALLPTPDPVEDWPSEWLATWEQWSSMGMSNVLREYTRWLIATGRLERD